MGTTYTRLRRLDLKRRKIEKIDKRRKLEKSRIVKKWAHYGRNRSCSRSWSRSLSSSGSRFRFFPTVVRPMWWLTWREDTSRRRWYCGCGCCRRGCRGCFSTSNEAVKGFFNLTYQTISTFMYSEISLVITKAKQNFEYQKNNRRRLT